ncbi:MAG: MFS transporter [Nitrososphaerota archaeon]
MGEMRIENNYLTLHEKGTKHRWKVLISTSIAYLYDSYDLIILALSLPVLIKILNIPYGKAGLLHSVTMIGAAVGSYLLGMFAERYSRKWAIVISLIWFGVGTGCIYLINTYQQWMVLRFITGIGIGGIWGPAVAIISAHWAPKYRARAASFMLSTFALGAVIASIVARFVISQDWRVLFLIGSTSILAGLIAIVTLPEDRQVISGVKEEKEILYAGYTGKTYGIGKEEAIKEKVGFGEIFKGGIGKFTLLGTLLNFAQMGGYWGAATWIPSFLVKERGLSMTTMANFSILMYMGMFLGYQVIAALGDKIGRKSAMRVSLLIEMIAVATYLFVPNAQFLFWWGIVVGFGFGGVFGIMGSYYAELFPERVRAVAGGFCFNVGRLGAVIAPFTVGLIAQSSGLKTGLLSVPFIFAIALVVLMFLPETYKVTSAEGTQVAKGA